MYKIFLISFLTEVMKLVFIIWLILNVSQIDAVIMKFTNYVCENMDESVIQIHQCRLKAIKRNVVTLHFNATLQKPVHQIQIELAFFKKDSYYKPWLYKLNVDACRFLRKAYNPLAILIYNQFGQFSNFNHTCPFEGRALVQGFGLKYETLPLPLPTGDYLVNTKWYLNGELAIVIKHYFAFVENL